MRIAIMGAGGIGAYVGARLAAVGSDVAFIARGAHLAALRNSGLMVESPLGDVHLPSVKATDNPRDLGPADVVLFTVKLWDTEQAAASLAPLVAPHTRVITLQNGIDSVETLARFVPSDQVIGGVIYVAASISRPGVISHSGGSRTMIVDEAHGDAGVAAFRDACRSAVGLEVETTDRIGQIIWEKFIRFAAFSAATSLLRTSSGPLLGNPETLAFLRQLLDEGVAIAEATGNAVGPNFTERAMAFFASTAPTTRSSMSIDLERGKPLELRWVSGRLHALGHRHDVPTPAHTAAYRGLILYADGSRG